jgi:hypothetical protein
VWIHVPIAGKETWPVTRDAISVLKERKYRGIIIQTSSGLPEVLRATCSEFGAAGIENE